MVVEYLCCGVTINRWANLNGSLYVCDREEGVC